MLEIRMAYRRVIAGMPKAKGADYGKPSKEAMEEMENWYDQLLPRLKHNHTNLFNHRSFNDFLRVLENAI